jgi:hypothetical protein
MFAAAVLLPTLILTALATVIGSILRRRPCRQATRDGRIGCQSRCTRAANACT